MVQIGFNPNIKMKSLLVTLVISLMWLSIGISHYAIMYNDDYRCTHMSRDFEDVVESFGIPIILMRGENNENAHLWVRVFSIEFSPVFLIPFPEHLRYPDNQVEFDDWEDYCEWRNIEP